MLKRLHDFEKGDIVHLKSGGPDMTVADGALYSGRVLCNWFSKGVFCSEAFAFEMLVKGSQPKKNMQITGTPEKLKIMLPLPSSGTIPAQMSSLEK